MASSNANSVPPTCINKCPLAILDSGASCHITSCKELFINLRPCTHVMTGVGSQKLQATAMGTMRLVCTHKEGWYIIELEDTLFVPESRITLVSTSRLLEQYPNASITFTATGGAIALSKTQHISLANEHGLYAFDLWRETPCHKSQQKDGAARRRMSIVEEPARAPLTASNLRALRSRHRYHS